MSEMRNPTSNSRLPFSKDEIEFRMSRYNQRKSYVYKNDEKGLWEIVGPENDSPSRKVIERVEGNFGEVLKRAITDNRFYYEGNPRIGEDFEFREYDGLIKKINTNESPLY